MPSLHRITWHELNENGLPDGTIAAVNVAGQNVLDPTRRWTPGFKQNVWTSRVNTASAFVRAINSAKFKPDVFINVSGVSLYRPSNTKIYSEDDAGEEYDFMSKLCLHWEQAATELSPPENVRLVWNSYHNSILPLKRLFIFVFFDRFGFVAEWLLVETVA